MNELPAGTRIDRYIIERPLGSGGFSTVYRASHSMIGAAVALKLLLPEHTQSPVIVERLFREARAAASIGNPHIVRVLDCGTSPEGLTFLTMELLEGQVLTEVMAAEGPLPVERALAIVLQVLDGLAAAHAAGIIHRDIKPENVFLTRDPDSGGDFVKLLDFGISKSLHAAAALTSAGEILGTPFYMAPEQIHGAAGVDHRADLYAVAAVLYQMLSGRKPVVAVTLGELLGKLLTEAPTSLEAVARGVGPRLSAVVMRGLSVDVDARWPDALSFAAAIRSCLPDSPGALRGAAATADADPSLARTLVDARPAASPAETEAPSWPSATLPAPPAPPAWEAAPARSPAPPPGAQAQAPAPPAGLRALLSTQRFPLWVLLVLIAVTVVFTGAVAVAIVVGVGLLDDDPAGASGSGQSISAGQAIMGTLQIGRTIDYPLRIERAGMVNVSMMSGDFDCYLRLLRDGAVIFEDDDGGGGLNARLSVLLVPGDYVVRAGSFQNADGGSFVLSVQ